MIERALPSKSVCPLDCPDTCSLEVHVEAGRVVRVEGDRRNPITDGFLCAKVRDFAAHAYSPERIARPLARVGAKGAGELRPISWDAALERVCARIARVRDLRGGEAILPLAYGGSNGCLTDGTTDALLFERLGASRLLRTVCAVPTTLAAQGMYGTMVGTALEDFEHARLIVVWGTNPHATGIHAIPPIKRARERGAALVVVDPRRTPLARVADLHVACLPGTDVAIALSIVRWLFETGRADLAFLERHATGWRALRERAARWPFEEAARVAGVPAVDLERFARLYAERSPAVVRCGWGLERNRNGCSAAAAVLALPAVAGKFGVRGGGYTASQSGFVRPRPAGAPSGPPPRAINMNRVGRALLELDDPPIELLFVYDCNPLATLPDQERVRRGLAREDLFTVVFDQVLTDTARWADVVLPATTFLEHAELRRSYGALALAEAGPVIEPVGEARPNYAVFAELLRRLGLARPGDPLDLDALRASVLDGLELDPDQRARLDAEHLVTPPRGAAPVPFVDSFPRTPDGRIHLVPEELDREAPGGLFAYRENPSCTGRPLTLISPASHRRVSSTFGQLRAAGDPLRIHPVDAAARGIADGARVRIANELGEVVTRARLTPDVRPGVVELPKGLWSRHTENGATANALVPDSYTDVGGGACFNDARVEVEAL